MNTSILVVDDNRGNRHFAHVLLKPEGFTVHQAPHMTAAFELLEAQPVDLIVADVRMPGGGGFDLYRALRGGKHAAIPFVLMSAMLTPDDQRQAKDCAGLMLAERPVDPDEYVALIRGALKNP